MQVKNIGSNQTEIAVGNKRILVSYSTPVAAIVNDKRYKVNRKYSTTTSRHINKFGCRFAEEKPQEFFDNLIK